MTASEGINFALDPRTAGEGQVYFALDPKGKQVKIGYSSFPTRRMTSIKTPSGRRPWIVGLEPGGRVREAQLHRMFAEHRVHGEWFRYDEAIQEYVAALPRIKPARPEQPYVKIVLSEGEHAALLATADAMARTRADTVRLMLTYGLAHMPEGYTGR